MGLSRHEQETIINFNKDEKIACIFTYEKTWQKHLEKKLSLKPTFVNSFGGREYEIDKSRIFLPRAPRRLSPDAKARLVKQLAANRQTTILPPETPQQPRKLKRERQTRVIGGDDDK